MSLNFYRFRTTWALPADLDAVYAVLDDIAGYPDWWPEVRAVRQVDELTAEAVCRSLLPYDLVMRLHQDVRDRARGVLCARLDGDLVGFSQWSLRHGAAGGTVVRYDQEVRVRKPLLRALAPLARPAFIANHTLMMRHAERGLRALLATRSG